MKEKTRTSGEIFAEMAAIGPMLPGSVRRTSQKKATRSGVKTYGSSPIYTFPDPGGKGQRSRRIPAELFDEVKALTENYRRFRRLEKEFLAAQMRENAPGSKKKRLRA